MKKVKPYYVSGHKNRLFDGIRISIKRIRISYKNLPFLPVVFFIAYPFFFDMDDRYDPDGTRAVLRFLEGLTWLPYLLGFIISIIYHGICWYDFKLTKIFRFIRDGENIQILCVAIFFVLIFQIILWDVLSILMENELIKYYIVTLPIVIGISYLNLASIKENKKQKAYADKLWAEYHEKQKKNK